MKPERPRRPRPAGQVERLEARSLLTLAPTAPLPDLGLAPGAPTSVDLDAHFKDPAAAPNYAIFDTTLGTIPVLLTPATTPQTVANFRNYVSKGAYTNTVVHRSVPGFIWQAGGFQLTPTPDIKAIPSDPAVPNEFGASNVRGTIAMAKLGSDPNSATNQFFFNESDGNAANLDHQNGGFTVFGHVVGAAGLAVMDAIAAVPSPSPAPLASPLDQIPLQNYTAGKAVQPANLILIKGVTTASETFTVASDAPGVVAAAVRGSTLVVNPVAAGTAHVTVTGYGSDGIAATDTFTVNVAASAPPPATPPPADPPPTPTTPAPTPTTPAPTTPTPTTPAPTPTTPVPPTPAPTPPIPAPTPVAPAPIVPVAPSLSDVSIVAQGAIPASAVAGQKARIQQTVVLTASSGPVTQRERVTLNLAAIPAGSSGDVALATASANLKLKAGKQARLTVGSRQLPATVPAGAYQVAVTVTDPDGSKTTVDTGKVVIVRAPQARPPRK